MTILKTRSQFRCHLIIAATATFLSACSAQQHSMSTPLNTTTSSDVSLTLIDDVTVKAKRSKATKLRAGTTWSRTGSIEQGDVYTTEDQVVIVNSFDVHEASIVIHDEWVVGYFLDVEGTFVEAKPVKISLLKE